MNKKLVVILSFIIIFVSILSIINLTNMSPENDDRTLVIGIDAEFPPYDYMDESGEYIGFDLDLAQEVCDRNNWTLVKQPIDWETKNSELNSGSIDCIWSGFSMNGREDKYTWSKPYVNNKQVIVVKKHSGIKTFANLKGKDVEVQKDSSSLAALKMNKKLTRSFNKLTEIANDNTLFMDLESGACNAIAMDMGVARYQIHTKSNAGDYMILKKSISSEQYGIGFKKGNTKLRDKVQATLDEMYKDGTVDRIAAKYKDYGVPESLIKH